MRSPCAGGGSNVPTQMGFGGYVKQARAPVEQYARQSFAPGDLGVLPPLGVWDPCAPAGCRGDGPGRGWTGLRTGSSCISQGLV